jgi:integrase
VTTRPRGTGTIQRTPQGRHCARLWVGRERITVGTFDTHHEAAQALDATLSVLAEQTRHVGLTLGRYGERVMDLRERSGFRAVPSERTRWRNYVLPWAAADWAVHAVTTPMIRRWLADLRGKDLAVQTRRNALNLLRVVLEHAVEDGYMETNPARGVRVHDAGRTDETSTHLSAAEAWALVLASRQDLAVVLALCTGARQGELRALRWADVDLGDDPTVTLRYGAPGRATKGGKLRHVPLLGLAVAALKAARRRGRLVLPSATGEHRSLGHIVDADEWRAWLAAAGIRRRVRWHDLRHTCATLLLSGGLGAACSADEVREWLGHASVTTTERYARATGERAAAAGRRLSHSSANGPRLVSPDSRMITGSHLGDLNPRPAVYETEADANNPEQLHGLVGRAMAVLRAARDGSPLLARMAVELAAGVLAEADRSAFHPLGSEQNGTG